jgi:hypothetical protein
MILTVPVWHSEVPIASALSGGAEPPKMRRAQDLEGPARVA